MTSIIANVNGAVAKLTKIGVVAIGRDAIAVVRASGTVASHGLITSVAGECPATAKDAHCLHLGIIDEDDDHCSCHHPPPLCLVTIRCLPWPHALVADLEVMATIRDDVPPSEIVFPVVNVRDGEEGRERRVDGGGITIVVRRSKQHPHTTTYSAILIVGEIMVVAAAAAQVLLL
jgi:hypothetical protein